MFKNALVYRIDQWEPPTQADIERRLEAARFAECAPSQPEAAGWVEPRGGKHGALLESVGGQLILQLCTENKPVPSGVIKQRLEAQLQRDLGHRGRHCALRAMAWHAGCAHRTDPATPAGCGAAAAFSCPAPGEPCSNILTASIRWSVDERRV